MKNFMMSRDKQYIQGYSWDVENAEKVVCIIHGINEHAGRYSRIAKAFNDNGVAVFSMDLRGHGQSSGTRGHCAPRKEVLKDVDMLIDYVHQIHSDPRVIIYGHSMGGNIALDYRSRGKYNGDVEGYIISAPWVKLVREIPKYQYVGVKMLAKIFPEFKLKSNIDEGMLGNRKNVAGYNKDPLNHNYISALCAKEGYEIGEMLYNGNNPVIGEGIKRPMLLMHGNEDGVCSVFGSRKVAELTEDICEYVEWEGLYHEIHNGGKTSIGNEVIDKAIAWAKNI